MDGSALSSPDIRQFQFNVSQRYTDMSPSSDIQPRSTTVQRRASVTNSNSERSQYVDDKKSHVAIDMSTGVTQKQRVVLSIPAMHCAACVKKIEEALIEGPGDVHNIRLSFVLKKVEFDKKTATRIDDILQHLSDRTDYSAHVVPETRDLLLNVPRSHRAKFMSMDRPAGVVAVGRAGKNARVSYNPRLRGARDVLRDYAQFSPTLAAEPPDDTLVAGTKHIRQLSLYTAASTVLTVPVLVMTWAPLPPHPREYAIASLVLASIVQFGIAGECYVAAFKTLFFSGRIEEEMLIVLSTTAAYVYSVVAFAFEMLHRPLSTPQFFETSTLLVTLIMVGELVSAIAQQRAVEAVSIRDLQERHAIVCSNENEKETEIEVDVRLLHDDDIFKVPPNASIITDGVVVSEASTVDESMITGESTPVKKKKGSKVFAGTLNVASTLYIRATRLPGENTISDIARMVDEARLSRAHVQETVDMVASWFVPVVIALAVVAFIIWIAVGIAVRRESRGAAAVSALTYAISVLAIACPCAIVVAVPMVILIAGGVGAKLGVVSKSAVSIELARKVTHVVFDKTGTLTQVSVFRRDLDPEGNVQGRFDVTAAVLDLVKDSRHPVSQAVAADCLRSHGHGPQVSDDALKTCDCGVEDCTLEVHESSLTITTSSDTQKLVKDVKEIVGKGVEGILLDRPFKGGSPQWLGLDNHSAVLSVSQQGYTTFCVTFDGRLVAVYALNQRLRPEAPAVINSLYARNIGVSILSGDNDSAVKAVARSLNIPTDSTHVRAGCDPAQKATYVDELVEKRETVLFCGDGLNDAVALAKAHIGVHMNNGEGAGVTASSAADVVLTNGSLTGVLMLMQLSEAVHRRIVVNFIWSFVYNVFGLSLAAGAWVKVRLPPAYAGLGEIVSVVPVILVALQLKWFKPSLK